jgi:hypothetical protein
MTRPGVRLAALADDLRAIYPGASVDLGRTPTGAAERSFRVLTSARRPRLAVPVDVPAAAVPALRRSSANDTARDGWQRTLVSRAAAGPLRALLFRETLSVSTVSETAVESLLAAVVGEPVRIALFGGSERANAKPVLSVHRRDGSLAGFAKVGISAESSRLVQHESAALRAVRARSMAPLVVPTVLHAADWHGGHLLFMSAVQGDRGRRAGLPVEAMRALVAIDGVEQVALRDAAWLRELRGHAAGAGEGHATAIRRLADALAERDGDVVLPIGAWHGDWGPWNMAWSDGRALVWDWERFAHEVPAGMDAAHFAAHARMRQIGNLQISTDALRIDAEGAVARVLASLSPAHRADDLARTVVDCYLLEIATRFAVDASRTGIAPVARLATWYASVAAVRLGVATIPVRVAGSAAVPTPTPQPGLVTAGKRAADTMAEAGKERGRKVVAAAGALTSSVRMLPDFLICGVQRAGTTTLYRALAQHPDVVAPMMHKGVHYFDTASHYARGLSWYRGHFPVESLARRRTGGNRPVTGEASPYYVFHPLAAERIAADLPGARLVVLLRDPVERAFSAHKQESGRGFETETFARALQLEDRRLDGEEERIRADPAYQSFHHQHHAYRRRGHYAEQLTALFDRVGRDRVFVVETDDLFATDGKAWAQLLDHLGLARWEPGALPRTNARPSGALDAGLRADLSAYFAPHDDTLADLLGYVPSWRR